MTNRNKISGFTTTELMVGIVIVSILAAVSYPFFTTIFPNIQFRRATRALYNDLQLAKMEAIKRNTNVVVQINNLACPGLPATVPSPGGGYLIFVDDDNDGVLDAGETTLSNEVVPNRVAICGNNIPGGNTGFNSTGFPLGNAFGTITLNNDNSYTSGVVISLAGNITIN